jgi:hypothetical protein
MFCGSMRLSGSDRVDDIEAEEQELATDVDEYVREQLSCGEKLQKSSPSNRSHPCQSVPCLRIVARAFC